jgi:phage portal protein BeeE
VAECQLTARMEWHAGLAGNSYVYRQPDRLRVLRPDWVVIVWGSQQEPDDAAHALDGELLGYIYCNGGLNSGNTIHTLLPQDVAHWSPIPDPEAAGLGMSWVTPAVRDIMGDQATASHKLKFFENGATPNLVVKGIQATKAEQFRALVDAMEEKHSGLANAYKTLYLSAGADATVVGHGLQQMDFKNVVEASENRIAFLSRVPASLLGLSQGMKGSSLNAGNFKMAQRSFTDSWLMPTLQDMCAALAPIVDVPSGAELWFDSTDVGLMREDSTAAAQINEIQARTITILVREGFTAESAISAVVQQDMSLLVHTNLISVQLQEPGMPPGGGHYVPVGTGPKAPPGEAP